ncbi:tRNA (adenosine(37)-N6)-threonylcarbamoyltransferase complex dimerization subunit type 1 TsaB [Marinomonas mediterranea]|jgi:universal bacterial protein YeaZ|uniref:tRNA threonylcarbamoyladenosine biosynthesis protein TsaB n=1 Tax=Marinomonas mediterranea (strain ATCC 700492 / JCM 21426 / NBRC 103028 / MMB-1) TaxID=717774 RepID=F2JTY0_MARM1|nr:tRNA (adenosine(37)-N6)-threonylcarbamoyltransferase complex dimerization subunit type 1 TsaB [Marinomonas mediterranea]ADZ90401.1 universal protein YeaZ [Marinomonas mediterranea MMB-1]WCN12510.1 tRNA (adenosine(37)-N6)-threonylcarbamoyltransferase complex dimerization subunit type 1 TsaB [Marinomonas mediterranea]WCN16582.1 tRNA (adenosine(37)-N6)-threonylcarbamoyltransferase complex dimerization subunit type 1 TsaB [Marinomonas mediterranea MMB-1]
MPSILALDTSTPACSVALAINGAVLEDFRIAPRQHNDLILPMLEQILAQAGISLSQLDAISFGRGPGSFTGLRISAGVVQGLAYGQDLPVIPVSTLKALAYEGYQETHDSLWLPALDARMGEVYIGGYQFSESESGLAISEFLSERVCKPDAIGGFGEDFAAIGSGWLHREIIESGLKRSASLLLDDRAPRAACIARLAEIDFNNGNVVDAYHAIPTYLRDEVTWEKQPPRIGKR